MFSTFLTVFLILESGSLIFAQNDEQEGDLRLHRGDVLGPFAGWIQMFYGGEWGAISEDYGGLDSAGTDVACYQMFGVRDGSLVDKDEDEAWEPQEFPVLFYDFNCNGDEDRLMDCPFQIANDGTYTGYIGGDDAIYMSCNIQEAFTFDKPEYVYTDYHTNPQVTINRYHLWYNDPVSAVDVRLQRVSLENSEPTTQRVDFSQTHSATSATVDIPLPTADEPDNPAVFELELTQSTNDVALLGNPSKTTVYIFHDVEEAVYTFEKPSYSVLETAKEVKVTINRTGANHILDSPGSVSVSTCETGEATGNLDFTPIDSRQVLFDVGKSSAETSVYLLSDRISEGNEMFILRLNDPLVGSLGSQPTTTITITDDDDAPYMFEEPFYRVLESSGEVTFKIIRRGLVVDKGSVDVSAKDGTALPGTDYSLVDETITFEANVEERFVRVTIIPDDELEKDKYFLLSLNNAVGGGLNGRSLTFITIIDDEMSFHWAQDIYYTQESAAVVPFTLKRTGYIEEDATVVIQTEDGRATAVKDYQPVNAMSITIPKDEQTADVMVRIIDDDDQESSEEFSLLVKTSNGETTLAQVYVVINDDDDVLCNPSCENGGQCSTSGLCLCPPQFTGPQCETVLCNPSCENGGQCSISGVCLCPPQFTGPQCEHETVLCNPPCRNGGQCSTSGLCLCPSEFTGPQCETVAVGTNRVIIGQFVVVAVDGVGVVFNPALNIAGSIEHVEFTARIQPHLRSALINIPGVVEATITTYLPGSVIAQYNVIVKPGYDTDADEINGIITTDFVQSAYASGITVDTSVTKTFAEELCPAGYCANGGSCDVDTINMISTCRCRADYYGNQCENGGDWNAGSIAGIVFGVMAPFIVILACALLILRLRRDKSPTAFDGHNTPTINTLDLAPFPYSYPRGLIQAVEENPMMF